MDFKVAVLLLTVSVAGVGIVVLVRRYRAARPSAAISEWDRWSALLDIGIGFCDHNLVLCRANSAFLAMFVRVRGGGAIGSWTGAMTVAEWLGDGEAVHPLQALLMRSLSGMEEVSGRVWVTGGECCRVRIRRIVRGGLPFFSVIAESVQTRNEPAGAAAHPAARDGEIVRISHDLRNSLNAMRGWLHLLETEMIPQQEIIPTVRRIQRSLLRQSGVIDELRKLANADHAIAPLLDYPAAGNRRH